MRVQVYAHRGSSAAYAEHTRAAYLQALSDGADGVECDVRLTADGVPVLLHDDRVDRTSNGAGAVAGFTLAQLRELDFSSWKGAAIPPEYGSVPQQLLTLDGLLDILAGAGRPVGLAIEFKYGATFEPASVDAVLGTLAGCGRRPGDLAAGNVDVSFMSFHPGAVEHLAHRVPAARLCQLLEDPDPAAEALLDDGVAELAGPGIRYLRANPGNAARWLAAGRTLRVWTVDTERELQLCLAAGAAEVTSNRPGRIRGLPGAV